MKYVDEYPLAALFSVVFLVLTLARLPPFSSQNPLRYRCRSGTNQSRRRQHAPVFMDANSHWHPSPRLLAAAFLFLIVWASVHAHDCFSRGTTLKKGGRVIIAMEVSPCPLSLELLFSSMSNSFKSNHLYQGPSFKHAHSGPSVLLNVLVGTNPVHPIMPSNAKDAVSFLGDGNHEGGIWHASLPLNERCRNLNQLKVRLPRTTTFLSLLL